MALSNRDKVGRGLELLAEGLKPFVARYMSAKLPAGKDWVEVLSARDGAKHGTSKTYSTDDPRFLLKVLTEDWRAFDGALLLSVAHPADVVVTANADGFCGFGRHGDADRREVTPVRGDL